MFPWAESALQNLQERKDTFGRNAEDYALSHFLTLLIALRPIILQDAALLRAKYPDLSIWMYEPFNTPAFALFSSTAQAIVTRAETDIREKLGDIPEVYAQSLRGILTTASIENNQEREMARQEREALHDRLGVMQTAFVSALGGSKAKRRKLEEVLSASTGK